VLLRVQGSNHKNILCDYEYVSLIGIGLWVRFGLLFFVSFSYGRKKLYATIENLNMLYS